MEGFAYWSRRLYEEIDRRVAVDFLPYNEREFAEMQRNSRLIRHALRTGKVLYERPTEATEVSALARQVVEAITRRLEGQTSSSKKE